MYHGWGFGCYMGASIDGINACSIEESIILVPDEGISHGGSMGAWCWEAQLPLRLAAVIVEMLPGEAECMSTQRDPKYPSEQFGGSREASKDPDRDMPTRARRADDFRNCGKQLLKGDVFPAEDVTLTRLPVF